MRIIILCVAVAVITSVCVAEVNDMEKYEGGAMTDPIRNEIKNVVVRDNKCGDSLNWTLSISGTLNISGTGDMYNFSKTPPWYENISLIKTVEIGDRITSIGNYAFSGCKALNKLEIPSSVRWIGEYAFSSCSLLQYINIPINASVGKNAFWSCSGLKGISVEWGHQQYTSFEGVLINTQTKTLVLYPEGKENSIFYVPDNITLIDEDSFSSNKHLTSVFISSGVRTIARAAFFSCRSLVHVSIPDSVTSIGNQAFDSTKIENITIPASVTSIGESVFNDCMYLTSITVEPGNPRYVSVDGVLIDSSSNTLIKYPSAKEGENYTIPSIVTNIQFASFSRLEYLENVVIPDNVRTIAHVAFSRCRKLRTVVISDSVTSIAHVAFYSNGNLTTVFFQGTTDSMYTNVFDYCDQLIDVCVSPEYEKTQFGGRNVTSTSDSCKKFRNLFNSCYKGTYKDGRITAERRRNATEWEKQSNKCYEYTCDNDTGTQVWRREEAVEWVDQTNECFEYQCDNESGFIGWSLCNSSDILNVSCVNGQCIENKQKIDDDKWTVIIEMDNVKAIDVNITELIIDIVSNAGISEAIDVNDIVQTAEIQIDVKGDIINIVLHVNTEETAKLVVQTMIEKRKEGCEDAICHSKNIRVEGKQTLSELSSTCKININFICLWIMLASLFFRTTHI